MKNTLRHHPMVMFLATVLTIGTIILFLPIPSYGQDSTPQPGTRISLAQAQILLETYPSTLIVDVRTQGEFNAGYIPGAQLLPNTSINQQTAAQVIPSLDHPVVVYCRSGARSSQATQALIALGYTRIYDLGPITAWEGPLERVSSGSRN